MSAQPVDVLVQAQLAALTARMHATVAGVEGMRAANAARLADGYAVAYDDGAFAEEARILHGIADEMAALARCGGAP